MENSALANRPLPSITEKFITMYDKKGNPIASEDIYKSDLLKVNTKYNEKEHEIVPISIEQHEINNEYMILEGNVLNKVNETLNNDKKGTPIKIESNKIENKMNYITQFYVGSLTVVGLFILYRMLQKTR